LDGANAPQEKKSMGPADRREWEINQGINRGKKKKLLKWTGRKGPASRPPGYAAKVLKKHNLKLALENPLKRRKKKMDSSKASKRVL